MAIVNVADNVQDGHKWQRPTGGKVQTPTLRRHSSGSVHLREVQEDLHPQRLRLPPKPAGHRAGEGHEGSQVESAVGHETGRSEGVLGERVLDVWDLDWGFCEKFFVTVCSD